MKREREAPGGHVQQREEGAVEHQRGAELAREQQRRHRRAPDDQHRAELLHRRDRQPEHAPAGGDEHLAVVAQVAGEEDHDRDLRELGRLEGDAADVDVQVGAVDLLADPRQARQHRHADRDRRDRVAISLEHAHARAAQREDRGGEQHQPDAPSTAPAGAPAPGRCGRPSRSRRSPARPRAGTGRDRRAGSAKRITRCAARHSPRNSSAVGQRDARGVVERQVRATPAACCSRPG